MLSFLYVVSVDVHTYSYAPSGHTHVLTHSSTCESLCWQCKIRQRTATHRNTLQHARFHLQVSLSMFNVFAWICGMVVPCCNKYGSTCCSLTHLSTGESLYLQSIQADPWDGRAWVGLAKFYKKRSQSGKARDVLVEGLKKCPANPFLLQSLGSLEAENGMGDMCIYIYMYLYTYL